MTGNSQISKSVLLQHLKAWAPEIFSEGKIDWARLKAVLGADIDFSDERYVLNWAGKSDAFRALQTPSTRTLIPAKGESKDFDKTENLFIEGENFEVLKILQKSYFGRVKMVYIDPPYNTGNDSFIYPDRFSETKESYLRRVGDKNGEGYMTREGLYRKNSKENGHYHSNWLSMMYPRLFLARKLLRPDGVIFVSIDDNEVHNLRLIMDEIFGEENFVEIFSWVKTSTPPALSTKSRKNIEYVLCYEKNKNEIKYNGEELDGIDHPLLNRGNHRRDLLFPKGKVYFKEDKFPSGKYPMGKLDRVELKTDIEIEKGYSKQDFILNGEFKWTQKFLDKEIDKGTTFIIKSDKLSIRFIRYQGGRKRPTNLIKEKYTTPVINKSDNNVGTNETASSYLTKLLGGNYFDYPKPVSLIKYLANFIPNNDNDLILDFFAGSGTTAHAVMDLNRSDGGNRKYICVQLPEPCDERSSAYRAGYYTIADIAKVRIRRAGTQIQRENPDYRGDIGFKVFKLSDSNFKLWQSQGVQTAKALEEQMALFVDPTVENASIENMVYELLLKSGLDLNSRIEKKYPTPKGSCYHCINGVELVLMLEEATPEITDAIIRAGAQKVIALDKLFEGNDSLKTNTVLQMRDADIDFKSV